MMTAKKPENSQPYALYIRGPQDEIFDIADALGFDSEMDALSISIFEDDPEKDIFNIQALFETEADAQNCHSSLKLSSKIEAFVTQIPDEDWVSLSQKGLPPVEAGRFWVYGAHDKDQIPVDCPWPIHIEAGPAFGTGHHGTTKGCLLIFDDLLKTGMAFDRILDLGCGAGTLAIAAATALDQSVIATDIDPDAVLVTQANAKQNNVEKLISAYQADGFASDQLRGQSFDLIFANILAGPLMGLAPDIANTMLKDGHVILSGILDEQADRVASVFKDVGLSIKKGPSLSGWTSLLGQKQSSFGR